MLLAEASRWRRTNRLATRGVSSDGYFGFDSGRRSRSAARIDIQSTGGRPDGNFRTAVGMRDWMPSDEGEQAGHWPYLNSAAQAGKRGGVSACRTHGRASIVVFQSREATQMINSVPVLLLGIVIMSMLGSVLGYVLEPGGFVKRDAPELSANPTGAMTEPQPPRLAA